MDNNLDNFFDQAVVETAQRLQEGNINEAVIISGELLARCDNNLRIAKNSNQPLHEDVAWFIDASLLHINALRRAKAVNEAFSCAVGALLTIEVYQASEMVDLPKKLRLYTLALYSAVDSFDRLDATVGDNAEDHTGHILSYLASLLYHNYQQTVSAYPDDSSLPEVYRFLKSIENSGAIQSPTIKLGTKDVEPECPGPLLVDILGRAAALGIYA